jgi:hypothetical protein
LQGFEKKKIFSDINLVKYAENNEKENKLKHFQKIFGRFLIELKKKN